MTRKTLRKLRYVRVWLIWIVMFIAMSSAMFRALGTHMPPLSFWLEWDIFTLTLMVVYVLHRCACGISEGYIGL